jgi:TIR domain
MPKSAHASFPSLTGISSASQPNLEVNFPPTSGPDALVFICYRRADSQEITGRIFDRLVESFGHDCILRDVNSIPYGINFKTFIEEALGICHIALVIIGPEWATICDEHGNPLQNPNDYVRQEIEKVLRNGIVLLPSWSPARPCQR